MDTAEFDRVERRHHKLVVTRNTEYHVRDGRVIAVRRRGSTEWNTEHTALGMTIQGRMPPEAVVPLPGEPGPITTFQGIGYVLNVDETPPLELPIDGAEVGDARPVSGHAP